MYPARRVSIQNTRMKIAVTVAVLVLSLLAFSCASSDQEKDEMLTLSGTLAYQQRIALSPDAVAHIRIVDLDLVDKPGYLVAQKVMVSPGQAPIAFELTYWQKRIESGHTYALQARIEQGGRVMFATREDVKFDANQPAQQDLVLEPAP
jgi:putative lipoprotein